MDFHIYAGEFRILIGFSVFLFLAEPSKTVEPEVNRVKCCCHFRTIHSKNTTGNTAKSVMHII